MPVITSMKALTAQRRERLASTESLKNSVLELCSVSIKYHDQPPIASFEKMNWVRSFISTYAECRCMKIIETHIQILRDFISKRNQNMDSD